MRSGQTGGGPDLLVGRVGSTQGDVVPYGRREEERLLEHDGDLVAEFVQRDAPGVDTVDVHGAVIDIEKAWDEMGQRRLARTGGAHDRDRGAARNDEIHAVEHGCLIAVAESDAVELDLPGADGETFRVIGVGRVRHGAQQLPYPGRGRRGPGQVGEEPAGDTGRQDHHRQILGEGDELAERDGTIDDAEPPEPEDRNGAGRRDQFEQRAEVRRVPGQFDGASEYPVGGRVEPPLLLALLPVGLDHLDAAHGLLDHLAQVGEPLLDLERESDGPLGVGIRREEQRRDGEGGDATEDGIDHDQHSDHDDEHAEVRHRDRQHGEDQAHLGEVRRRPGHELACRGLVMEAEPEPLHVGEHPIP